MPFYPLGLSIYCSAEDGAMHASFFSRKSKVLLNVSGKFKLVQDLRILRLFILPIFKSATSFFPEKCLSHQFSCGDCRNSSTEGDSQRIKRDYGYIIVANVTYSD